MTKSNTTPKELLFSDFLKEDALKPEKEVDVALTINKTEIINYKLPNSSVLAEDELKKYWRSVRNYFRTGKKVNKEESTHLMPVLLAKYLTNEELPTEYPIFLSIENEIEHCSFSSLLDNTFKKVFKQGEAEILFKNLIRIENFVGKYVSKNDNFCSFNSAFELAIDDLSKFKINGTEGVNFLKDLETFKNSFSKSGNLVGFSQQTPIHILAHLLKYQYLQKRESLISEIHHLKSELNDLLAVDKGSNLKGQKLGFADSFIEFNTLDTLLPERASESMSENRAERIANCVQTLGLAESLLLEKVGIAYVGKALTENKSFNWEVLLSGMEIRIAPENESCTSASEGFNTHISKLSKLIAAIRIAELELKGKYDEEIHGEYFSRFNWNYFTDLETELCPPIILIESTQNLLGKELSNFSSLIASTKPVKILSINKPLQFKINKNGSESENVLSYQQELSALVISHRSAFTLQSAVHNPMHLLNGYISGISASIPSVFHVLFASNTYSSTSHNFLTISSSVEGRQFPLFIYDAKGKKWGSRFNINANPQPDKDWPKYLLEVKNNKNEIEKIELAFTFADFSAINNNNLLVIPSECWTDDLIPLNEYLDLSSANLYAKVPFIWLVDNENNLHKAAVPYSLVIATKERLDFWNFIQELGGVNSYHVEQAVERTQKVMLEEKEREIKDIEIKFEKEIEEVRSAAAGEAMNNLAGILLNLDTLVSSSETKVLKNTIPSEIKDVTVTEIPSAIAEVIEKETSVSSEPWVETFRCTSCNECTDKYPRAFKYDGEKQAYLEDPTTITFAQMVKAAEDCPAKCIHPGMPINPNEPGLDELIARAKPFN